MSKLAEHVRGRSVLLDANVLVLEVVGRHDPLLIDSFKRTSDLGFNEDAWRLLSQAMEQAREWLTTPHVLAESGNLLGNDASPRGKALRASLLTFARLQNVQERWREARELLSDPRWFDVAAVMGITDAVLLSMSVQGACLITTDYQLAGKVQKIGGDAINFNHFLYP